MQMVILLADTKAETSTKDLAEKTSTLLSSVLQKWQMCEIHPACFEKVVSMCTEEVAAKNTQLEATDKKTREKSKARGPAKSMSRGSKSVSSKSSHSPGGGREESKPASSALLSVCLQVFILLASLVPDNSFFIVNARTVREILEACFLRAKYQDEKGIRKRLKAFLIPFLVACLDKHVRYPGFDLRVRVLLENFIGNPESDPHHSPESLQGQESTRKGEGRCTTFDDGRVGGSCLAFFALDIILEVSKVSPSFVESFSGSLVSLAERLVSVHLKESASEQRLAGVSFCQLQPTPTCGIIDEAATASRRRINAENDSQNKIKTDSGWKQIAELGTSIKSAIACVRLVSMTDLPFNFSKNRQIFMHILGSILDSSDNIHLLLAAVGIAGKWLVSKNGAGPLAVDEKIALLRKISSLDSRPIPPIVAQSLADLVGSIVLAISDQWGKAAVSAVVNPACDTVNVIDLDSESLARSLDSFPTVFHRALAACILNAHSSVRQRALTFYVRAVGAADWATADLDALPPTSTGRSVFDMLWKLIHSDYEAVGGRMWPLIFADALMSGCMSESGVISMGTSWLPRPNRSRYIGSNASAPQECLTSFFECMSRFKEPTVASRASVLCLAHFDLSLVQRLFESLMVSAWRNVGSAAARALLISPMEQLLSRRCYSQDFINSHPFANSVQSVLKACGMLHPQPFLDPEVLVSLGGMYHATHDVLSILEKEYKVLGSLRDTDLSRKVVSGICTCLQQLGEQNLVLGLAQKLSRQAETNYVLSLDMHGLVSEAGTGYSKLVDLAEARGDDDVFQPNDFEIDIWENRWAHLQKEMCQMKVIEEFASLRGDHRMLLEAAWKNQDWDKVDALKSSPEFRASYERGDPLLQMSEILSAIMRGKLSEVEDLHAQTAHLCLQEWQSLPGLANGSHQHSALLHFFHRLVEFRESGQIMVEITNHSNRRTLPDLQNLLR